MSIFNNKRSGSGYINRFKQNNMNQRTEQKLPEKF